MKLVADDGTVLDATFFVEHGPSHLVYESAGGRTVNNARNRDYGQGLELLLLRLAGLDAVITDIWVDSVVTRRLPLHQRRVSLRRYQLPLSLARVADLADLKRDLSTSAREPGARAGASRGGSSRRLRIGVEAPPGWLASDLERALAGRSAKRAHK
jgi:hypothetical protein